jgi:S1/P1 Nuclease
MTMTKLFYCFSKLHKLSDFFNVFFVASHVVCFSFRIYAERFNNRYCFGYVIRPKPAGPRDNPKACRPKPRQAVNILTALAENERIAITDTDAARNAIALTWLFHLVGDIHQPFHSTQIFTTDYPNGDRGGNLICLRPTPKSKPMVLHRFWDGVITNSTNTTAFYLLLE